MPRNACLGYIKTNIYTANAKETLFSSISRSRDARCSIFPLQLRLPSYHLLPLSKPLHSIADHLIHNLLGTLLLVDYSCSLAHEEWAGVVHGVIINVVP